MTEVRQDPAFAPAKTVDWAMTQPDYDTGIAYFVSNLLRIEQNLKVDPNDDDPEEVALLSDLRLEPVVLVQRNKDKPWPYLFTTQDIYCTPRTAALYGFPGRPQHFGFRQLQDATRARRHPWFGERAASLQDSYYVANSNRHRVSMALYLGQGSSSPPRPTVRPAMGAQCHSRPACRKSTRGSRIPA